MTISEQTFGEPSPFYRGHERTVEKEEKQAFYRAKRSGCKKERLLWSRRAQLLRGIRIYGPTPLEACARISFAEVQRASRWDGSEPEPDALSLGFRLMGME